jgi:hypothetical protein
VTDARVSNYGSRTNKNQDLGEQEKCAHITSLNEQKPTTRNKLRITRSYKSVQADLQALDSPPQTDSTNHEASIEKRWGTTVEHFLPASLKHSKSRVSKQPCDSQTLAAIDILSSFTQGQARLAREVLEEAVTLQTGEDQGDDKDPVVRKQDVLVAVQIEYERAGVIPAKFTKGKSEKAKDRERRKAAKGKKKAGGVGT